MRCPSLVLMAKHPPRVVANKHENAVLSRKFRKFLRWMRDNGIEYSDGLAFELGGSASVADIGVKALVDMKEGDLIATIPKEACLTMLTTAASSMLDEAEIGGGLGLVVALMYERSLQERSKWYGYLQLLPNAQNLPILWTPEEIEELLAGTELHQVIKEDRMLMEEDWKESIVPLTELSPEKFPVEWFSLYEYLAAKTLVSSRAFGIDEYHGYGMVPLADLFNHKTADEDVHFTNVSSDSDTDAEEVEAEEPPPSPSALKNGKKRDKHAQIEEDQERKYWKAVKFTKATKEGSRVDGHPDVQEFQPGLVIKQEETVKTQRTKRKKRKHLDREKDRNVLTVDLGESSKPEVFRNLRRKQTQMVKNASDTEPGILEKPTSQQKVKAKKNTAEVEFQDQPAVKDKSETQRSGTRKGRHRNEVEVEVQDSTKVKQIGSRGSKQRQLEELPYGDNKVYQSSRRGGNVDQVEMLRNGIDLEDTYQSKGQSSQKHRQVHERSTQLAQKVEDSSDVLCQAKKGSSEILEMILVKDVAKGSEVFNTYGTLSNAALLHRYGFTELNNPFDIVNIDLSLVVHSFGEAYTSRHVRRRVTKWRKVCCSPLDSQDGEYFEISAAGKPEEGLLMLMYILHLTDEHFDTLTHMPDSSDSDNKIESVACFLGWGSPPEDPPAAKRSRRNSKGHNKELGKEKQKVDLESWLLTAPVCWSVLSVLRQRNGLYPTESLEADEAMLSATDSSKHPEIFHAFRLRISERSILRLCQTRVTRQLDLLTEST